MALSMKVTYKSNTAKVGKEFKAAIDRALTTSALLVQGDAKLRSPVDTGNLRSSISHKVTTNKATIFVPQSVSYGVFVEYGTSRQAPQPYMEPALRENKAKIISIFKRELGKGVR